MDHFVGADTPGQFIPVQFGHVAVHQHGAWTPGKPCRQARLAVIRGMGVDSQQCELPERDVAVDLVVFHQQDIRRSVRLRDFIARIAARRPLQGKECVPGAIRRALHLAIHGALGRPDIADGRP